MGELDPGVVDDIWMAGIQLHVSCAGSLQQNTCVWQTLIVSERKACPVPRWNVNDVCASKLN